MCIRDSIAPWHIIICLVWVCLLFIKVTPNQENWKLVIPTAVENKLILDYHIRYGHMGAIKIVKALEEQVYIKNINRKVQKSIQACHILSLIHISSWTPMFLVLLECLLILFFRITFSRLFLPSLD